MKQAAATSAQGRKWLVYCLKSSARAAAQRQGRTRATCLTYVGATVDLARRLRQHNGEIQGGAKYTRLGAKGSWSIVFTVEGFREQREALQFEWAIKHKVAAAGSGADPKPRRKRKRRPVSRAPGRGVPGRVQNLARVLALPHWTKRSPPSADVPLQLSWSDPGIDRPPAFEALLPQYVTEAFSVELLPGSENVPVE